MRNNLVKIVAVLLLLVFSFGFVEAQAEDVQK